MRTLSILPVVVAALLSSCGTPAVGYQGPIPTVAARQTLDELWGTTLPAGSVAFTNKPVKLSAFLVGPHAPTVIVDEQPPTVDRRAGRHWIPVFEDGDIADLHRRAAGAVPRSLASATTVSDGYRKKMTGR